jgi:hypothetical protein
VPEEPPAITVAVRISATGQFPPITEAVQWSPERLVHSETRQMCDAR